MGIRAPEQPKLPNQFDAMRRKTEQQLNTQAQQTKEEQDRKFAASNMLNSGANIKQQQILNDSVARQKQDAMFNIDAAEQAEMQRRADVLDERNFTSGEAQKGREFAGLEAQKGRDFSGQESALGRKFQQGVFDKEFGLKENAFGEEVRRNKFSEGVAEAEFNRDSQTLEHEKLKNIIDLMKSGDMEAYTKGLDELAQGAYGGGYQRLGSVAEGRQGENATTPFQTEAIARRVTADQPLEGKAAGLEAEMKSRGLTNLNPKNKQYASTVAQALGFGLDAVNQVMAKYYGST